MKNLALILIFITCSLLSVQSQDYNLLDSLENEEPEEIYGTFKSTRIITAHSIERMKEGQLEFRISHRFGRINTGIDNFFGLDQSNIFLSVEYGITDWLEAGIGRTPIEKLVNGFLKWSILRQKSEGMPVSLSYLASLGISAAKFDENRVNFFTSRLHYVNQLLIAKKFNTNLSIQIMPTYIHRNLVATELDENDIFALGLGGRYKISKRVSLNMEYFYVLRPEWNFESGQKDPLSLGVDIETGGHVFQIMLTNSYGMIEKHYIAENTGNFWKGDIHLGFNISRTFTIYGDKR